VSSERRPPQPPGSPEPAEPTDPSVATTQTEPLDRRALAKLLLATAPELASRAGTPPPSVAGLTPPPTAVPVRAPADDLDITQEQIDPRARELLFVFTEGSQRTTEVTPLSVPTVNGNSWMAIGRRSRPAGTSPNPNRRKG
jgi:hypothetical protein